MHTETRTDTQAEPRPAEPRPAEQAPVPPRPAPARSTIDATAPGQLRTIKRNGTVVPYDESKIAVAITKAFLAVEGGTAAASSRIRELVKELTIQVGDTFRRRMPSGGTIHIEEIQDQVELALMRAGEHKVARDYVLYRDQRARERALARQSESTPEQELAARAIEVTLDDGSTAPLDLERLHTLVGEACAGLDDVNPARILEEALKNMFDGITLSDVGTSLVMSARTLVEEEPNYTYATARLLMDELRRETLTYLGVQRADAEAGDYRATCAQMADVYPKAFAAYVARGIELELLSPDLRRFDLARLGAALDANRDQQFTYLGLQTLYDRYFLHASGVRIELPQCFFMRVAMGLAVHEDDPEARAIEFYNLISSFDYMSSTPTLFNSGTLRPQLSSCYLTTVPDDLH
ncbi:MAG: ribonucleoside-diphosphate reductase subunit alpha, partial [Gammaproteobacteria bacterium]|nr:ribonucleoside-diphosphate reductase subunit alpha [Gammaproteobacteria bacterium]